MKVGGQMPDKYSTFFGHQCFRGLRPVQIELLCNFKAMDQTRIQEIVRKVFDRAEVECAGHSKNALCNHIADRTPLSARTLDRLHGKYISNRIKGKVHNEHTINSLCSYLGYESYADYVKQHGGVLPRGSGKIKWALGISLAIGLGFLFYNSFQENSGTGACMVWEKDHFEASPCVPGSDRNIEPLDPVRLANFKKIEVYAGYEFFNEATKRPRVWYHKNKKGEIEYYSAPGLHPINGKTLDEITPYIIDKYVPIHNFRPTSFTD